jgi:integrase/recombinase XerD
VTELVEARYDQPRTLAGEDEGSEMRKLRAEMHHRMLGDGCCVRPVELDCYFESIRKSCSFFVSTIPPRHRRLSRARRRCSHRREHGNRVTGGVGDGLGVRAVGTP